MYLRRILVPVLARVIYAWRAKKDENDLAFFSKSFFSIFQMSLSKQHSQEYRRTTVDLLTVNRMSVWVFSLMIVQTKNATNWILLVSNADTQRLQQPACFQAPALRVDVRGPFNHEQICADQWVLSRVYWDWFKPREAANIKMLFCCSHEFGEGLQAAYEWSLHISYGWEICTEMQYRKLGSRLTLRVYWCIFESAGNVAPILSQKILDWTIDPSDGAHKAFCTLYHNDWLQCFSICLSTKRFRHTASHFR